MKRKAVGPSAAAQPGPGEQPSEQLERRPGEQPAEQLTPTQPDLAQPGPAQPGPAQPEPEYRLRPLEQALGVRVRDRTLFERAFIHRSYLNELLDDNAELVDNERLEFLGDTVLGFIVSEWLYHLFPEQQEGDLTNLRSALVRRETLARLAQDLRLGDYLMLGHGEEESGGRTRPATLCAVFEAMLGAVYLDLGLAASKDVLFRLLTPDVDRLKAETHTKDPKSRLQEHVQASEGLTPRYKVADTIGPDHAKYFIMQVQVNGKPRGIGQGRSKQEAAQQAAAMALYRAGLPAPEYRADPPLEARYGFPREDAC